MKIGHIHRMSMNPCGLRFDSSYHLSDGVTVKRDIAASPYPLMLIGKAAERIFIGGRARRVYVKDKKHGIPFLSSSDILQADLENVKLASKKYTPNIEEMTLQKGWTLITRSGTIGNCAFANAKHAQKLASEDVIRLVPNDILKQGYIYAYLASKPGYSLLTQGTFGAVIQHIEPAFVASLPIPVLPESFQQEVDGLIQESARLREEATRLLETAKKLLSDYINNDFASTSGCVTATRNIQDIRNSLQCRLDPPALMNNSVLMFEYLKDYCVELGSCNVNIYRPGIFKRCYVKEGLPYIKGSEIFSVNPFMRCDHLSRSKTPFVDLMKLREGQLLITCAGSVGQVKYITKEYENKGAIGSQDIIRIESNDALFTAEYLFAYLQLPLANDYMQSMKYGSVIERIEPFHVESISVVKPTQELSDEITALIKQYKDCTYRAFCAEEKAISMVEQEIESWTK